MERKSVLTIQTPRKKHSVCLATGQNLRDVLHQLGLHGLSFPCGGNGICGKCIVHVDDAGSCPPTEADAALLTYDSLEAGYRLGCTLKIPANTTLTITLHWLEEASNIITAFPGTIKADLFYEQEYGCAVDIGTTTIAIYLVDRSTGEIIGTTSLMNNQRKYGGDVISRIQYSDEHEKGLSRLHTMLASQIQAMIMTLLAEHGIEPERVSEVIAVGNPTIIHFLLRKNPSSIARSPFTPQFTEPVTTNATLLDLEHAELYVPGIVSAFIGSDITAGIHAFSLTDETEPTLYIDIGTNGEIVLWDGKRLYGCSSAAGPAFEGVGIHFGMAGSEGAIDRVWLDEDGMILCSTIGGGRAKGICGSAIIDCVALMVEIGLVDETGALKNDHDLALRYLMDTDQGKALRLTEDIYFTARDVREVQLAKAAIATGIDVLLAEANLSVKDLSNVMIAGGFGSHISTRHAQMIGLLPLVPVEAIRLLGNAAGKGAIILLNTKNGKELVEDVRRGIRYIELSSLKEFQTQFVEHLFF